MGEVLSEQCTLYSAVIAEPLALKGIFFRIKSIYKIIQWHDDQADRNSTTYMVHLASQKLNAFG